MNALYVDSPMSDDERRRRLYEGQLFVFSARPSGRALCEFARELTEEAFAPLDPRYAQADLPVERYVAILAELKPRFIHHPRSKTLIQTLLADLGCNMDKTYFDVPRLRTVTYGGYLTSGLGYAFKPHRDSWYSRPMCQLNWWLPVYPTEADNTMAFHTPYWDRPVRNSSSEFDYQDWNRDGRKAATRQHGRDTRKQSAALESLQLDPQLRVVTEPGGLMVFSAAHLHSTVPNTTTAARISIDFRTVYTDELRAKTGAPNIDSACRGTTIRDYLRGCDLTRVPEDIRALYEEREPQPDEVSPGVMT